MTDEDFPDLRKGVRCIYLPHSIVDETDQANC